MELLNKQILILGEGVSGKGTFAALEGIAARFFYYEGCLDKTTPDLIVTSPGIAAHPAIDTAIIRGIPVISELELGYLLSPAPMVGITGTNGKTTVTRLIGDIAKTEFKTIVCGNIGQSYSEAARKPHKLAVVEASSFQLLDCYKLKPAIAVITNLSPDHLDRHGSMENYRAAKLRLTQNQTEDDYLICPSALRPYLRNVRAQILYSGLDCRIEDDTVYFINEPILDLSDIMGQGAHNGTYTHGEHNGFAGKKGGQCGVVGQSMWEAEHNKSNLLQAVAAAKLLGVENNGIREAVSRFCPEPHRLCLVSTSLGKRWFDDSKATNIDACLAACRSMRGDTALILGGSDKGYDYDDLFLGLPSCIKNVYIMGGVKKKLADAAARVGREAIEVANMLEAVTLAADLPLENILLSPAAASFDNFQNYAQRGRAFLDAISYVEKSFG